MPAGYQPGSVKPLLTVTNLTTTGNSATFQLALADCYLLALVVTAATGTSPVVNAVLQTTLDAGVTWINTGNAFASTGAAGTSSSITFKPTLALGEAASPITVTPGTASAKNQPINHAPNGCRLSLAVSGTTPSVSFTLYQIGNNKGYAASA